MLRFVIRRLLVTLPMVLVVVSLTWGLIRLAPGNFYSGERAIPPAIEQNIREKYGLDKPWYVQYGRMIGNIARGDFGSSLRYLGQPVNEILVQSLPVSATLGTLAYLLALTVGIVSGTLAALRQNTRLDYSSMAAAMVGISMPNFVLGPRARAGVLAHAVLAAAGAVGGVQPEPDHARADAVGGLHGLHRAADAFRHARGAAVELHPHRARQGLVRAPDARSARAARRPAAGRLVLRSGAGVPHHRHGRRRAHLRAARSRQLLHQREPEPRRAAHHRHRRVHVDRRPAVQSRSSTSRTGSSIRG